MDSANSFQILGKKRNPYVSSILDGFREPEAPKEPIKLERNQPIDITDETRSYVCPLCPNYIISNYKTLCDHFVYIHPYRINFLKNIIPVRKLSILKARIFVEQVLTKRIISNEEAKHNSRDILYNLIFSPTTYQFVRRFQRGKYNADYSTVVCNLEKHILYDFIKFVNRHIQGLKDLLDTLPFKNPMDFRKDEDFAAINFENYIDMNFYKNTTKNAFFFVDNLHVDSGESDQNLKSDDLFSSPEEEPKKFDPYNRPKIMNKIDQLDESDR